MTDAPYLLVTDLDGTLLDASGCIHAADLSTVKELERRGVIVTIATGRMFSGMRHIANELGTVTPVACVDGAHIADPRTGTTIALHGLPGATLPALRSAFVDERVAVFGFGRDVIRHSAAGARFASFVGTWSPRLERVPSVLDHEDWDELPAPVAVIAIGPQSCIEDVVMELEEDARLQLAAFDVGPSLGAGLWGLVIRDIDATKGSALRWLSNHHAVPLERTIVVGDWLNDIPMMTAAGYSFAMAQAPASVKRAAKATLRASVSTGGAIREVAERVGLL